MHDCSEVLLFLKSPEKGRVKSRLAKAIGEGPATDIYKCFVHDRLETLKSLQYPFRLFFYPLSSEKNIKEWLGDDYSYSPQYGKDLGERMLNAFLKSFSGGVERAVLIGCDVPEITPSLIDEAFNALDYCDAVIGPALDGGYYLIGFKKDTLSTDVFHGIEWGSGAVFAQTMNVLSSSGSYVHVLKVLSDVDTLEDLLCCKSPEDSSFHAYLLVNNDDLIMGRVKEAGLG